MKVTTVLQAPGNEPVTMTWTSDAEDIGVVVAVAQILQHHAEAMKDPDAPFATFTRTITIEVSPITPA